MARCAANPLIPALAIAFLLVTFKALCAVVESMAAMNPINSKVGEFHDAAAIPTAMGINESNASALGSACLPSINIVNKTVMSGMAHLEVYVSEIPIRFKLIELA